MTHPLLIVLPYCSTGKQGNELYLCLYSWKKYACFDYHFVVCGGKVPEEISYEFPWVENVVIPRIEPKEGQYRQHLDYVSNWCVIKDMFSDKHEGFVFVADDYTWIHPFTSDDVTDTFYLSESFTGQIDKPVNFWTHDLAKTRMLLDKEGLPHVNYTTHYPTYFEFDKLFALYDRFDMYNNSYVIENIYHNVYVPEKRMHADSIRLGLWGNSDDTEKLKTTLNDSKIKMVVNSVRGYSKINEGILMNYIKGT